MGKSKRLRLRDLRDAFRLIGECRDLGSDVRAWRERMLQGLRRLVEAQVAVGSEFRPGPPGGPAEIRTPVDLGWPSPEARRHFVRYVAEGGPANDPTLRACLDRARPIATLRRDQIIDDRAWYASPIFHEYRRPAESDDWLGSAAALSGPTAFHVINLDRPPRAARFTARERRLIHVFHHEVARLVGSALQRGPGATEAGLSARLRATLACLLEGDSEKQVALRLGLSRHTVHDYVKALYRRFDAASRAELLARVLKQRGLAPPP